MANLTIVANINANKDKTEQPNLLTWAAGDIDAGRMRIAQRSVGGIRQQRDEW